MLFLIGTYFVMCILICGVIIMSVALIHGNNCYHCRI